MKTKGFGAPVAISLTTALVVGFVVSGCCGFQRHWKSALRAPVPSDDTAGPWEGEWVSDKNGHRGRLRCVMQKTSAEHYQAHFHARFWKVFSYSYDLPLTVQRDGNGFRVAGESDLGWLAGGIYSCEGTATATDLNATYKSKYDHGIFKLHRP